MQDACRILEGDPQEVLKLTKSLNEDEYDSMDAAELCEHHSDFKEYYEVNKEIVDLALELRGRIKSQGQHAGGIIISSEPLSDVVPMTIKNGKAISQWTEGMSATQLSPVGLVKFDILGLKTMAYNVYTEELIKESIGIKIDWNECDPSCEIPYAGFEILPDGTKNKILFNDDIAIKMADDIKTEAVFQFDTHVAKSVLANGVTNFHDLVAYTALARPGPMDCIAEGQLINTKNGYIKIEKLNGEEIEYNSENGLKNTNKYRVFYSGRKKIYKIKLKNGKVIKCSGDHQIMTKQGFCQVKNLKIGDLVYVKIKNDNLGLIEIESIEECGIEECYDIGNFEHDCMENEGNFLCNDILVHNCIPEYVARRDDPKKLWMKKEDPRVVKMLEDTQGIICFHEDTMVCTSDGYHKKIKDINIGDEVSCIDLKNKKSANYKVVESKPTVFGDGIKITLLNGRSITVTKDHNILGYYGYIKASNINIGDLIAIPHKLDDNDVKKSICEWIGEDNNVAYLIGQLVGDGCLRGTSYSIAVGNNLNIANTINNWILHNTSLETRIYWHCRSYYVAIKTSSKVTNNITIDNYIDSKEWFLKAYNNYSAAQIAKAINKSNWYVYNKLSHYGINITNKVKNPWKTKLHDFIENIGLKKIYKLKRIPEIIFNNAECIKYSFLSGLIESDGCLAVNNHGTQICYISSSSQYLLLDIDRLCLSLGIPTTIRENRIYLHDTKKLSQKLTLLYKSFDGSLHDGNNVYYTYKDDILSKFKMNQMEFSNKFKICRASIRHNSKYFRHNTSKKTGYDNGDIRYSPVKKIEIVKNCQFYNISVPPHHNIIANGIIAKQCYQEQLTEFWIKFGGLTVPEAEKARKAVAKKKTKEVLKLLPKIVESMIKNGFINDPKPMNEEGIYEDVKPNSAQGWSNKMVSYGRYAFNRSHAYAYGVIAYRSLWLKSHYPVQFWASILTYCHPDKVAKYVGVARSEGVDFKPLKVGHLYNKLTIDKDFNVFPSLMMIKGVGASVADKISETGSECKDINDFILKYGKNKKLLERLIKLGAFEEIHPKIRKHLWFWYQYKYSSKNEESDKIRLIIDNHLMNKYWPEEKLQTERERQKTEFIKSFPKKKVPVKITKWLPKLGHKHDRPNFQEFIDTLTDMWNNYDNFNKKDKPYYTDWNDKDLLRFEKEFLGVYWSSPMKLFLHNPNFTFQTVKEDDFKCSYVDGIIEKIIKGNTKKGFKYLDVMINDGIETNAVRIWETSLAGIDRAVLKEEVGIRASVEWNDKFKNFNLSRNGSIHILQKRQYATP